MATDGMVDRWNNTAYGAGDERRMASVDQMPGPVGSPFSARSGRRVNGAGLAVSVSSSGNGSVTVSPGPGRIYDDNYASQAGWDFEVPNPVGPITLGARPAAGQSRIDRVIARIYDKDITVGSVYELKIEVIPGDAAPTPGPPAMKPLSMLLGTLTVPNSGPISVTQSAGGVLPVATTDERDQLVADGIAYRGLCVFNAQTGRLEAFDGTAWIGSAPRTAGNITTNTNATGFVTFNHGGPTTPKAVQLAGRNFGHYPYLTALDSTTVTVRFVSRNSGAGLTAVTAASFDWSCDF
jgi:hypothetical protein